MKEQNQHYELTLIIPGSKAEDEHKQILEELNSLLKSNGAENSKIEDLGRKKLAYAIKNLRHGFYFAFEFDLLPKNLKKMEKNLRLNKNILRFLTIKKRVKTEEEIAKEEKIKSARVKEQIAKQKAEIKEDKKKEEKTSKPKVSLEDLDKKLDELLDDKVL